ncbi:hypothetical protein [uncultured Cellulomonas sp.]|uniref:hypothetical protein n=1 Tax=uncultured Cellulomonas sp. TaxID=189682 RepID=UPI0028ECBAD9|nr:hypothetical protein [uncultured Cellulomonas sp.]
MSADDTFTRELRSRIDVVGPPIRVDTSRVIGRARRRRAVTRSLTTTAAVTAVAVVGWAAASAQPWTQGTGQLPGGTSPVVSQSPVVPTGSPEPAVVVDPADLGWPDAPYWRSAFTTSDDGRVDQHENWYGHSSPGLITENGDLATASGMGPALWGVLLIDGTRVQIHWDELYALPTSPVTLERLLRASVEPDRGTGSEDDKVFALAVDLLVNSPAPPPLRRAVWALAQDLPGTVVTPGQTDSTRRPATLLARTGEAESAGQYWFDPADGRLLEMERHGYRYTFVESGPDTQMPREISLEESGCFSWETC